jgi:hypothetical protein
MPVPGLEGKPRGESRFSRYEARLQALKQKKAPWLPMYQSLAEMFYTIKADFTRAGNVAEFLQDNIFDNTPQFAAAVFASVCVSMLWPDAARTFNIVPKPFLKGLAGVEAYFRAMSAQMHQSMDNPEAGLTLALGEYFLDFGVFGMSGLATLEGPDEDDADMPIVFENWDVKTMYVDENSRGYIDRLFIEDEKTVRQVYEEYVENAKPGDKVSARVETLYNAGKYDEKVIVVKVIEPKTPVKGKKGILGMKWATCHLDMTNRVIMREGGFEELPVAVGRMFKRKNETQGRSCGMIALPAAINLNSLRQDLIEASEKNLKPPLMVLDDGRLGGAVIDTSADGMTVINTAGRPFGEKPVQTLFTVGEMQSSKDEKENLVQEIMQAFFLDRLLDLNNKTMMTAYETSVRNRLRGEATGSLFSRQIMEMLIPTIKRSYNVHYRKGYFGDFPDTNREGAGSVQRRKWMALTGKDTMEVPDVIRKARAAGLEIFDIEFISPAQRFMQAEKLQGIMTTLDTLIAVAQVRPDILDNVDLDEEARMIYKFSGHPVGSLRTVEDLKKLRASLADQQRAGAALEAGKAAADIGLKGAQARSLMGTMGNPVGTK